MWFLYLIENATRTRIYTGITTDVPRRLRQHNGLEPGGAAATRAGRPWALLRVEGPFLTRGEAQRREAAVKALSRKAKLILGRDRTGLGS